MGRTASIASRAASSISQHPSRHARAYQMQSRVDGSFRRDWIILARRKDGKWRSDLTRSAAGQEQRSSAPCPSPSTPDTGFISFNIHLQRPRRGARRSGIAGAPSARPPYESGANGGRGEEGSRRKSEKEREREREEGEGTYN